MNYILVVHAPVHFTNDARSPNPSWLQLVITKLASKSAQVHLSVVYMI